MSNKIAVLFELLSNELNELKLNTNPSAAPIVQAHYWTGSAATPGTPMRTPFALAAAATAMLLAGCSDPVRGTDTDVSMDAADTASDATDGSSDPDTDDTDAGSTDTDLPPWVHATPDQWPAGCVDNDRDLIPACDGEPRFATDCDDSDPDRYPGCSELCNGVDDDCDGVIDEYITSCETAEIPGRPPRRDPRPGGW